MTKTPTQTILELTQKKPIEEILRDTLERFRGRHNNAALAALYLGVSVGTIYSWCARMGIDILG